MTGPTVAERARKLATDAEQRADWLAEAGDPTASTEEHRLALALHEVADKVACRSRTVDSGHAVRSAVDGEMPTSRTTPAT